MRRLVSVLIDNAVKYASPGSPITLRLEKDRRGVVIRSSNGCENVDADETKKLFDRFYRTDKARSAGGFGIGLSICLLYTSPSPRDLSTSRMPSSA